MGKSTGICNYFVDKIWNSKAEWGENLYSAYDQEYYEKFGYAWDYAPKYVQPKIHTIREDKKDRWKVGNKIHFVIDNRTKFRFQFAPVLKVKSVQKIEIRHSKKPATIGYERGTRSVVLIDDVEFFDTVMGQKGWDDMKKFAQNDGFNSVDDFFKYFNSNFVGKIIHWTSFSYCG